jgi:AraC family transcriptional regulator, ethanolamine operon transcriptional activator
VEQNAFNDFDAYVAALQNTALQRAIVDRIDQLRWEHGHFWLDGIQVQQGREGAGIIVEGTTPQEGHVLVVPVTQAAAHSLNGQMLDDDTVGLLEPGSQYCFAVRAAHDWFSVFIPCDQVADLKGLPTNGLTFGNGDQIPQTTGACNLVRPGRAIVERLRSVVRRITAAARMQPEFLQAPASTATAKEELLEVIAPCFGAELTLQAVSGGRPHMPRQEIARRALAWLENQDGHHVSTHDLARAADISDRTLRAVFHEYFGVSPLRFLKLRQLHEVRRALMRPGADGSTVAAILTRFGVWEFGRFAGEYRRLFHERPSDTLLNGRR